MPSLADAALRRGDTLPLFGAVTILGAAQNIAGWIFFVTAKTSLDDTDADAQFQFDYTVPATPEAMAGTYSFEVPHSKTANLVPGAVWLDIQLVIPRIAPMEPFVKTVFQEQLPVLADATQKVAP